MAKEFAESFYRSKAWKRTRAAYIAHRVGIDGGMCERCREQLGYIVHHRVKLTALNINDLDVALNFCNLEYDCKDCHDKEHYRDKYGREEKKARCCFDAQGNPVPRVEP